MFFNIGSSTLIQDEDILGIFDLDKATVKKDTKDYLNSAEKKGRIIFVGKDLPKAFIVTAKKGIDDSEKIYLTTLSPQSLSGRIKMKEIMAKNIL